MLFVLLALAVASPPADLVAVGIVLSADPARSTAILRSAGRSRVVGVGERVFGGRVVAVTTAGVSLEYGATTFDVRLTGGEAARTAAAPGGTPAPPGGITLARAEMERRLGSEIPRILSETALAPVMDGGRVRGLALTRVAEGSLLTDAGLRPGDVLTEINGLPVDSLATLMALYPRLQTEKEIRAVVLRSGEPVTLFLTLR